MSHHSATTARLTMRFGSLALHLAASITLSTGADPRTNIWCADPRVYPVKEVNSSICEVTRSKIAGMGSGPRQWVPDHYFWTDEPDNRCWLYMWSETQTTSFFPASDIQYTMDLILQFCDNRPSTDGRHGGFTHLRNGPRLSLDWIVSVYGPGYIPPGYGVIGTQNRISRLFDTVETV